MNKKKIVFAAVGVVVLCVAVFYFLQSTKHIGNNPFKIAVIKDELLVKSVEKVNSVEVYEQNNRLIVNAKSEMDFFDGAQFLIETKNKITASDVEIIWTTIGGKTEKTEHNDRIIAEIRLKDNGNLMFDKKINFARKAFDAVEDVLEKYMK